MGLGPWHQYFQAPQVIPICSQGWAPSLWTLAETKWLSRYGPRISIITITWKSIRNTNIQVSPQTTQNLWGERLSDLCVNKSTRWGWSKLGFKKPWDRRGGDWVEVGVKGEELTCESWVSLHLWSQVEEKQPGLTDYRSLGGIIYQGESNQLVNKVTWMLRRVQINVTAGKWAWDLAAWRPRGLAEAVLA